MGDHDQRLAAGVDGLAQQTEHGGGGAGVEGAGGLSAKTTAGRVTRARAMATRCCWPPESWEGRWPSRSARPTRCTTVRIRLLSGRCPASCSGRVMFCMTVSAGSRLKDWKMKPIRSRRSLVSRVSSRPARSVPPTVTVPEVGWTSPAAQCRKVLLPDPDGPMTAVKVPSAKLTVSPRSAATWLSPRP
ncbi:hypothetical protein SCANM63S_08279 [Streptomyces canarius]